jgi:hypothetical protein
MAPVALGTTKAKVDGQTIVFDPVSEIAPGETLTFRARVLAKEVGTFHLHVEMTTPALATPMEANSDETEVRN